ncbi:RNA-splicing factor [Microbotryomycetes sp. JL221]|nr:RNA-splicing factor [Microbotryomycetes sp. JL221]
MGGGDLNMKKSWHPLLHTNQERVWKKEQQALEERKRLAELQKELEQERALQELQRLQEAAGGKKRENRVEWLYAAPAEGNGPNQEELEAYLLGKKRVDKLLKGNEEKLFQQPSKTEPGGSFTSIQNANTARDTANKIREDPLLAIKRQEQMQYEKLLKNPAKLRELRAQHGLHNGTKKSKKDETKEERRARKEAKRASKYDDDDRDRNHRRHSRDERDHFSRDSVRHRHRDSRSASPPTRHRVGEADHRHGDRRDSYRRDVDGERDHRREDRGYARRDDDREQHRNGHGTKARSRSRSPPPPPRDDRSHRDDERRRHDDRRPYEREPPRSTSSNYRRPPPPSATSTNAAAPVKPSIEDDEARKRAIEERLAAMQSSASALNAQRSARVAEADKLEAAELAKDEANRKKLGTDVGPSFMRDHHKQVFGGMDLAERMKRNGRSGLVNDRD